MEFTYSTLSASLTLNNNHFSTPIKTVTTLNLCLVEQSLNNNNNHKQRLTNIIGMKCYVKLG